MTATHTTQNPTDAALFAAYCNTALPLARVAADAGLSVPDLLAWLERPDIAPRIAALHRFEAQRAELARMTVGSEIAAPLVRAAAEADDPVERRRTSAAVLRWAVATPRSFARATPDTPAPRPTPAPHPTPAHEQQHTPAPAPFAPPPPAPPRPAPAPATAAPAPAAAPVPRTDSTPSPPPLPSPPLLVPRRSTPASALLRACGAAIPANFRATALGP